MSDRPLKLLLIDQDPIFRLGLRVALAEIPNLQILSEVETDTAALQVLAEFDQQDPNYVNLVVLELGNYRFPQLQQQGLQFCRQLKVLYPNLPVLLLSSVTEPELLLAAKAAGVNGYCPKGTAVSELVTTMQAVAQGGSFWFTVGVTQNSVLQTQNSVLTQNSPLPFARLRNNWRLSGIAYIEASLQSVTGQLQVPGLPVMDQAILAGRRRELLAARWLLNRLLATPQERQPEQQQVIPDSMQLPPPVPSLNNAIAPSNTSNLVQLQDSLLLLSPRTLQSNLFAACITKLQLPLENVTDIPLEIDILRADKKRELLYLILQKLAKQLDELRVAEISINQLYDLKQSLIYDLWQSTVADFFGRFSRVPVGDRNLEIVNILLQNPQPIQTAILQKIPLLMELFTYLLFQRDLQIDNTSYSADSPEAKSQALIILENFLIQVANGVVQPLLNYFADVEVIKQDFYDHRLISTREIERFRNDLSWKYRLNNYINEPTAIFESRYELFVFAPRGIAKTSIYAPRNQELTQLSGMPLVVTLLLEFRDAIAPRLKSLLAIFGSGIVFILTQVIGRGLGLIGRGILQGIGNVSLTEKNLRRNSDKGQRTGNRG
ncbi:response regulator receiver protein [Nostoc carneum NIES-2107]|nr:response regulator receiver protein [Nostoc carneum NIES-2107]